MEWLAALILLAIPSPVLSAPIPPPVAAPQPTLNELADSVATEHGIATTTFSNLIYSESRWNRDVPDSPQGDRGLLQINRTWHPEVSDECAYDAECAMRWSAQRIKDGYLHEWVPANCYAFVRTKIGKALPKMKDIIPNSPAREGGVAIFYYKGVKHVAYITGIEADGFHVIEANYKPALITKRFVSWNDPNLVGYWYGT